MYAFRFRKGYILELQQSKLRHLHSQTRKHSTRMHSAHLLTRGEVFWCHFLLWSAPPHPGQHRSFTAPFHLSHHPLDSNPLTAPLHSNPLHTTPSQHPFTPPPSQQPLHSTPSQHPFTATPFTAPLHSTPSQQPPSQQPFTATPSQHPPFTAPPLQHPPAQHHHHSLHSTRPPWTDRQVWNITLPQTSFVGRKNDPFHNLTKPL